MKTFRIFLLAFTVGLAASFAPSCSGTGAGTCSPANCNGCCSGSGICQTGATSAACGSKGSVCVACSSAEVCQSGACVVPSGNDGGSCSATCTGGCCAPNGFCITPANTPAACGTNGGACAVCQGSQQCSSGQCVDNTCNGCVSNGSCVAGNADGACGLGGGTCQVCTGAAHCTNNQCVTPTCNGCVDGNGVCQTGNTNAACGIGGITCAACTGSSQCTNNQCITPTCNGCLDAGVCEPGNTNTNCGTAGEACLVCTGAQQCNATGNCVVPTCNGCIGGGTCQTGNTNADCGLGGVACVACAAQHQCTNGVCVSTCTGCVDSTGTCQPGNTNGACGTSGVACLACGTGTSCVSGQCQFTGDGGTTLSCTSPETYATCGGSCGVERWGAKVLTDAPSAKVNMSPQLSTVAQLITLPTVTPGSNDQRGGPNGTYLPEFNTYLIRNANLSIIKSESDLDYHLVLADPDGHSTMIGEIPCPNCASGSAYQCYFTRARHALEAKFGAPPSISSTTPVTLIGAAFYDPPHGQTGAAPNNLEIHSIMAICFGTNCDPTTD